MSKTYRVDEIFRSISGETSTAGTPSVFVRLHGCNLNCPYCDTPQGKGFLVRHDYEILAKVIEESLGTIDHVILTGGEPLRQDVTPLLQMLNKHGFTVQVETNGTVELPNYVNNMVSYAMDIKLPSSQCPGYYADVTEKNIQRLMPDDEIKFVIGNKRDFESALWWIEKCRPTAKLLFSPMFNAEGEMIYSDFIEDLLNSELKNWRIQVQLHKIVGVK